MAAIPPVCDFNQDARAFRLKGVDGKTYDFDDIKGPKGTLVMFICNHCPYVKAIIKDLVKDCKDLKKQHEQVYPINLGELTENQHEFDGFLNCSEQGHINTPGNPFDGLKLNSSQWSFDVVYTPAMTTFLKNSAKGGAKIITGIDLFLFQGIESFIIFTEQEKLRKKILKIRNQKLENHRIEYNVGSFFKNPIIEKKQLQSLLKTHANLKFYKHQKDYKVSAAWLIEQANLKGFALNKSKVSKKHSLVLVLSLIHISEPTRPY